jgi:hypothetical protein
MNHITITGYQDFDEILKEPLSIAINNLTASKLEYPDMWCLSFTPEFFKELGYSNLIAF